MTQQDLVKVVAGAAIGAVVAAAVVLVLGKNAAGDTETDMTLSMNASTCELAKSRYLRVKHGKHLKFDIENYCLGGPKEITLGNFKLGPTPEPARDCSASGPDNPFTSGSLVVTLAAAATNNHGSIVPSTAEIKLKTKTLPDDKNELEYAFDVCLDDVKYDPKLIVER